jgi:hypothetical protein
MYFDVYFQFYCICSRVTQVTLVDPYFVSDMEQFTKEEEDEVVIIGEYPPVCVITEVRILL